MNISDIPSKILKAFGVNGLKNTIPVDSSTTTDSNGVATFDKGFPTITMQPLSAGGKPPAGQDMNGILNAITVQQQWQNAGGGYPFDATFASAIGGYPKGARLASSSFDGEWLNTINGNTSNPENTDGTSTGWVPVFFSGITSISLSSSSVTLTAIQAARGRVVLSGTLTSNVFVIFPAWINTWTVVNNCTGNFSVICRTASGSGTSLQTGTTAILYGDGSDLLISQPLMTASGSKPSHAVNMGQFYSQLSPSGYIRIPAYQSPTGYLLIQWGLCSSVNGAGSADWPVPFPNAVLNVQLQESNADEWGPGNLTVWGVNTTGNNLTGIAIKGYSWNGNTFVGAGGGARFYAVGY
jgi:hypothetical protein